MTGWEVYWLTRLDAIRETLGILCVAGVAGLIVGGILYGISCEDYKWSRYDDEMWERAKKTRESQGKWARRILITCLFTIAFSLLTGVFVPTLKEAAAIYLIPPIVNNEDMQEIPADAAKLLHNKLEEWIEDTAPQGHTKEKK